MQGPYDVEFRTISVSGELRQRALEQQRLLDEATMPEPFEPRGVTRSALRRVVQRLLGPARSGSHWADDDAGARVASTIAVASESQSSGDIRVPMRRDSSNPAVPSISRQRVSARE
jgi:hypothetical protein